MNPDARTQSLIDAVQAAILATDNMDRDLAALRRSLRRAVMFLPRGKAATPGARFAAALASAGRTRESAAHLSGLPLDRIDALLHGEQPSTEEVTLLRVPLGPSWQWEP